MTITGQLATARQRSAVDDDGRRVITDEQVERILHLTAFKPEFKYSKGEWFGHDTSVGTTEQLGKEIREILR